MIGGNQFRMGLALLMSFSIFGASNPIEYLIINRIVLIPVSRLANQIDSETGAISGQKKYRRRPPHMRAVKMWQTEKMISRIKQFFAIMVAVLLESIKCASSHMLERILTGKNVNQQPTITPPNFDAFESPIIASRKVRCRASLPETSNRYPKLMNCRIGMLAVIANKMIMLAIPNSRDANVANPSNNRKGQLHAGESMEPSSRFSQAPFARIKRPFGSKAVISVNF